MNARHDTASAPDAAVARAWAEDHRAWLTAQLDALRERVSHAATATAAAANADADADAADAGPPNAPAPAGLLPALDHCAAVFRLSPFERELLLLVAGLELDEGLRAAVLARNGGASAQASFALACDCLAQPHWDALSPSAPLRHWLLVEPLPGAPLARAALCIDERVLHFVSGVAADDARLAGVLQRLRPDRDDARSAAGAALADALRRPTAHPALAIVESQAQDRAAEREAAVAAAAALATELLWIDAQALPADAASMALVARRIDREQLLTGGLPVLAAREAPLAARLLVAQLRSPAVWLGPPEPGLAALAAPRQLLHHLIAPLDDEQRRQVLRQRWRALDGAARQAPAADQALDALAERFRLDGPAIDRLIARAAAVPPSGRAAALEALARESARDALDTLAQRVPTQATLGQLVLPPAALAALRELAAQLPQREQVHRRWGFDALGPRGLGLAALFTGESGTGKTFAAEAVAQAAGLDLYRVDLASTVSKYIGETEKNLKRLFDAAEASGAVLLFDEADALFGKRSEVRDSHDRYANIEIAYLLQRVEAYRGLVILTTNLRSAIDRAFLRRIRFVVAFPFPDAAARERIWRRQFPAQAPLDGIDFTALAALPLAGGNIRGVALNAAFRAAAAQRPIDQAALVGAARAELAKLERPFADAAPPVRMAAAGARA